MIRRSSTVASAHSKEEEEEEDDDEEEDDLNDSKSSSSNSDTVIMVRDCIFINAGEDDAPFVAKVEGIWKDERDNITLSIVWYYRWVVLVISKKHFELLNKEDATFRMWTFILYVRMTNLLKPALVRVLFDTLVEGSAQC